MAWLLDTGPLVAFFSVYRRFERRVIPLVAPSRC